MRQYWERSAPYLLQGHTISQVTAARTHPPQQAHRGTPAAHEETFLPRAFCHSLTKQSVPRPSRPSCCSSPRGSGKPAPEPSRGLVSSGEKANPPDAKTSAVKQPSGGNTGSFYGLGSEGEIKRHLLFPCQQGARLPRKSSSKSRKVKIKKEQRMHAQFSASERNRSNHTAERKAQSTGAESRAVSQHHAHVDVGWRRSTNTGNGPQSSQPRDTETPGNTPQGTPPTPLCHGAHRGAGEKLSSSKNNPTAAKGRRRELPWP